MGSAYLIKTMETRSAVQATRLLNAVGAIWSAASMGPRLAVKVTGLRNVMKVLEPRGAAGAMGHEEDVSAEWHEIDGLQKRGENNGVLR